MEGLEQFGTNFKLISEYMGLKSFRPEVVKQEYLKIREKFR